MLRELNKEELDFVFGGDGQQGGEIIVNGQRFRTSEVGSALTGSEMGTVFIGGTNQYLLVDNGPQYDGEEILVQALTRTDPSSSSMETALERSFFNFGGGYGNAEQNADGSWSITASLLPTDDQVIYEANYTAVNTLLMQQLIPDASARVSLAIALTERGYYPSANGMNMADLYQTYDNLLNSGAQTDRSVNGFANWVVGPSVAN